MKQSSPIMLISDYAKIRYYSPVNHSGEYPVRTMILVALLLLPSAQSHAQRRISDTLSHLYGQVLVGTNAPIAAGAVLCLQPGSLSPANRNYSEKQLQSLYCVRNGEKRTGYVTGLYQATNPPGDHLVRVQVPLSDNTIQIFWVLLSEMLERTK